MVNLIIKNKNMNESIKQLIKEQLAKTYKEIKDLTENEDWSNTFKVIASTADVDRVWDSLEVDKWDDTNYKKNPVIQVDHVYKVSHIAWKMTKLYKEDWKLMLEGIFTDITEYWKICKELYNAWFLKAVSVGFITHRDDKWNVLSYELLEVSFVSIPCNPNAVTTEEKKLIKKWIDLWIIKVEEEEKKEMEPVTREEFNELKSSIENLNKTLWVLADGKALPKNNQEDGNSEDIEAVKTMLQWMVKNIGHALFQMKKEKKG